MDCTETDPLPDALDEPAAPIDVPVVHYSATGSEFALAKAAGKAGTDVRPGQAPKTRPTPPTPARIAVLGADTATDPPRLLCAHCDSEPAWIQPNSVRVRTVRHHLGIVLPWPIRSRPAIS